MTVLCTPAFGQPNRIVPDRTDVDRPYYGDAVDWYNKGVGFYNSGNYDQAFQAFDYATRLDPQFADAWYIRGLVLSVQGKYDEAIQAYDKAIELYLHDILYPHYATRYIDEIWYNKGIALKALGRKTESESAFAKAKELEATRLNAAPVPPPVPQKNSSGEIRRAR
ncbi:MAG: tetratricopeptide repeat protein [Methanotrichaceae archaeon]|nr:tetratricopeptide repeat protein [Methanotrichaceae archaeon]